MNEKKPRVKKLTIEQREAIIDMAKTKKHTYVWIAKQFGISRSRVSQLVNDNYDERQFLEATFNEPQG